MGIRVPTPSDRPSDRRSDPYAVGRRDAYVDATLAEHEKRLLAINGSIERAAQNAARLSDHLNAFRDEIGERMDKLVEQQRTRVAVEQDRALQVRRANEKALDSRTFLIGIASVVVLLVGVIVSVLAAAHVLG